MKKSSAHKNDEQKISLRRKFSETIIFRKLLKKRNIRFIRSVAMNERKERKNWESAKEARGLEGSNSIRMDGFRARCAGSCGLCAE